MSYVTREYYEDTFKGESVEAADFPDLLTRAEEIVEEMTMYRLNEKVFDAMSLDSKERVKKAICAQIEYLEANGGSGMDMGESFQSASLGKFSYNHASGTEGPSIYAPRALRYLTPTGLLYRGGDCY